MGNTLISWTDKVWNAVTGCTQCSSGCANCYAKRMFERNLPEMKGQKFNEIRCHADRLEIPLHWRPVMEHSEECKRDGLTPYHKKAHLARGCKERSLRIFVNSMSDLFHPDVPFEFIDRVFAIMALCPQHTFQVLTKRPARMLEWFNRKDDGQRNKIVTNFSALCVWHAAAKIQRETKRPLYLDFHWTEFAEIDAVAPWPLPNVWLGVSAEDQQTADERIPFLLQTPSVVRFISAEPLLAPVDLRSIQQADDEDGEGALLFPLDGEFTCEGRNEPAPIKYGGVKWVICGGESGPGARPCNIEWLRSIVQQCKAADVPVFVKQLGAHPVFGQEGWDDLAKDKYGVKGATWDNDAQGWNFPISDRKGANMGDWPESLRVQRFPEVRR